MRRLGPDLCRLSCVTLARAAVTLLAEPRAQPCTVAMSALAAGAPRLMPPMLVIVAIQRDQTAWLFRMPSCQPVMKCLAAPMVQAAFGKHDESVFSRTMRRSESTFVARTTGAGA